MNYNDIMIRQAKTEDIHAIAKIKTDGWKNAYQGIVDDAYLNAISSSEQIYKYENVYSLELVFVAERNGETVGFCRFYRYVKSPYEDNEIDCEIRELYVKPALKRTGIGSQLFQYTVKYFKQIGKEKLYVGCLKDNAHARKFYEKMGGISKDSEDMKIGEKNYQIVSYIYDLNNQTL